MRQKTLRITLVAVAIAGAFMVLGSWKRSAGASRPVPCKESMEQCSEQKSERAMWETTGQFFTSVGLN